MTLSSISYVNFIKLVKKINLRANYLKNDFEQAGHETFKGTSNKRMSEQL